MIKRNVVVRFTKEPDAKDLELNFSCSGIISGLKVGDRVCLRQFNFTEFGDKKNTLQCPEMSGTNNYFSAKLSFSFINEEEETRVMKELHFYLNEITPKGSILAVS